MAVPPDGGNEAAHEGAFARLNAGLTHILDLVWSGPPSKVGLFDVTIERAHYPLMHRNLDGPGYVDFAPRIFNGFLQRYAEPLFPPRGLIPDPVLKDLRKAVERPEVKN